MNKLTKKDAEQISGEIENQGFGYWVENYATSSLKDYPELVELAKKADFAMRDLEDTLAEAGVVYE